MIRELFFKRPELFPLTTYFGGTVENENSLAEWVKSVDTEILASICEYCKSSNKKNYLIDKKLNFFRDLVCMAVECQRLFDKPKTNSIGEMIAEIEVASEKEWAKRHNLEVFSPTEKDIQYDVNEVKDMVAKMFPEESS